MEFIVHHHKSRKKHGKKVKFIGEKKKKRREGIEETEAIYSSTIPSLRPASTIKTYSHHSLKKVEENMSYEERIRS